MIRRTLATVATTALLLAALAGQALAVDTHLHCMTTPGGTHSLARGITLQAPHETLHKFHFNVHLGTPFNPVTGSNPNGPLAPDFTIQYDCPPSP